VAFGHEAHVKRGFSTRRIPLHAIESPADGPCRSGRTGAERIQIEAALVASVTNTVHFFERRPERVRQSKESGGGF
jgi:hypothetical protein